MFNWQALKEAKVASSRGFSASSRKFLPLLKRFRAFIKAVLVEVIAFKTNRGRNASSYVWRLKGAILQRRLSSHRCSV